MRSFPWWMPRVAAAAACALVGATLVPGTAQAAVRAQKWAVVAADGTLARGAGATSASRLSTGTYLVTFDGHVQGCAYEATSADPGSDPVLAPVEVTVASHAGNGVTVQTVDQSSGALADWPFHLKTYCNTQPDDAVVDADGTTVRGSHVVSSAMVAPGDYEVIFDRDVSRCAFTATIGSTGSALVAAPGLLTVAGRFQNANGVYIESFDRTATTLISQSFHLAVECGPSVNLGVIRAGGGKARGVHVLSSAQPQPGLYTIVFDRNVTTCAYTATIGEPKSEGVVTKPVVVNAFTMGSNANGVLVEIWNDVTGFFQSEPFHLIVTC